MSEDVNHNRYMEGFTRGFAKAMSDLEPEIERLREENKRFRGAIEYAHGEGFDWPADPFRVEQTEDK